MKRSTVFSAVLVMACLFVGSVLKVEAARFSAGHGLNRPAATAPAGDDASMTWAAASAS